MKKPFRLITIVFFLFILWILFSADTGKKNIFFDFVNMLPNGDKLGHFFLFGTLTLLLNFALRFKSILLWQKLPLGTILVSVFVLLEELSQAFFPNRTLDIADLIADGLGILIFTLVGYLIFENKNFRMEKIK
ncbi:Vault protein inter-alpha-trypsin [Flavobacteriales bacterium ALC-1]|nr:Vault protein inter-alpha-trypsin [Flavobacteriales bacterium ALC-1]